MYRRIITWRFQVPQVTRLFTFRSPELNLTLLLRIDLWSRPQLTEADVSLELKFQRAYIVNKKFRSKSANLSASEIKIHSFCSCVKNLLSWPWIFNQFILYIFALVCKFLYFDSIKTFIRVISYMLILLSTYSSFNKKIICYLTHFTCFVCAVECGLVIESGGNKIYQKYVRT